jgi:hypothetical protein
MPSSSEDLTSPYSVLPTVDPALDLMVAEELERNGVRVLTSVSAHAIKSVQNVNF